MYVISPLALHTLKAAISYLSSTCTVPALIHWSVDATLSIIIILCLHSFCDFDTAIELDTNFTFASLP